MSQGEAATRSAAAQASNSEKSATISTSDKLHSSHSTSLRARKARSCLICRSRKVRCDKKSPCSNCRRANIDCLFPATDHPPRWARGLARLPGHVTASNALARPDANAGVDKAMDRLQNLERLFQELSGQLSQARAALNSASGASSEFSFPGSSTRDHDAEQARYSSPVRDADYVHNQFGRLIVQDASRSHYVSNGFWSRVDDELDGLRTETQDLAGYNSDSSTEEASPGMASSTQESERTPSERHEFLFRHNLSPSAPDLHEFHPLPSQIPFLVDVFSENVNFFLRIVHMPTINEMVRDLRGTGMTHLSPSNEALMFSMYYAAITSMEEEDIVTSFGCSKSDLGLKYRLGLEHALARADFLTRPDIILVQAFTIFLCLARRHDSPRFVWMMTGLLVRMAQYLGLQRDGAHFKHLAPFEIEMRRRVWWAVYMLDVKASEDQGTDPIITSGSFDTKIPLNINDADISLESKEMPPERQGVTDGSKARILAGLTDIGRQIIVPGSGDGEAGPERQSRLLREIQQLFEHDFFESENVVSWMSLTVKRLVMAKSTLFLLLPFLFSSPSESIIGEVRTKLLVAAIEVAEHNHALNSEQACRQWRWIYQTTTHWHAIVYAMIEISRRPWSPLVERAWVALHSKWLIPDRARIDKTSRIWFPLRKLMNKAHQHRDAELARLRTDQQAATKLEMEDQHIPVPPSSWPFSTVPSVDIFRERWRLLVGLPKGSEKGTDMQTPEIFDGASAGLSMPQASAGQPTAKHTSIHHSGDQRATMTQEPNYLGTSEQQAGQKSVESWNFNPPTLADAPTDLAPNDGQWSSYNPSAVHADFSDSHSRSSNFFTWPWPDADYSVDVLDDLDIDVIGADMDLDGEVDWRDWVDSARSMECDTRPGNGWS